MVASVEFRLSTTQWQTERIAQYHLPMIRQFEPTPLGSDRPCPCGGGKPYGSCCEPLHLGGAAATAENLMRSRYSAFCLGQIEYLLATRHPDQRQPNDRADLMRTLSRTKWVRLQILATRRGTTEDDSGQVEFVATYEEGGAAGQLHERSDFVKENGRWFYHSGQTEKLPPPPKPGRNEACWCGSGKKYKKCHLRR